MIPIAMAAAMLIASPAIRRGCRRPRLGSAAGRRHWCGPPPTSSPPSPPRPRRRLRKFSGFSGVALSQRGQIGEQMGKQLFLRLRWLIWLSAAAPAGAALALGTANPPSGLLPWVALAVLCADAAALGVVVAILLERRPRRGVATPTAWRERHEQLSAVRHLLERHGEDSISPFILRPDKAYAFAGGGVLAY